MCSANLENFSNFQRKLGALFFFETTKQSTENSEGRLPQKSRPLWAFRIALLEWGCPEMID